MLREYLPEKIHDKLIEQFHEGKGSYELFPKQTQATVIEVMSTIPHEFVVGTIKDEVSSLVENGLKVTKK